MDNTDISSNLSNNNGDNNSNKRNIVVQKFGGSSVADVNKRKKVIEKILKVKNRGDQVVVVISAMGRFPDPYATDSLLSLMNIPQCQGEKNGNEKDRNICYRDQDLLVSCGEIISCVVLSQMLRDEGYPAKALTGWQAGILTDDNHTDATILDIDPTYILKTLDEGKIPIVAGFQGMNRLGDITTLGRGGSDTSGTALGMALKAQCVEIYTDVDGVLTASPQVVPDPRVIPEMHYQEAGEMANEGAKVLHKRCVEPAERFGIPLWIKSTVTDHRGTRVSGEIEREAFERRRVVTSVVHIPYVAQVVVDLIDEKDRSQSRLNLLKALGDEGISLDLINIVREQLYFIVPEEHVMPVVAVCKELDLPVKIIHGCAKVSCIGIGMKGTPGVMAKIQESLAHEGVNILHSTDSHITISCLIKMKDLDRAVAVLVDKFNLRG